MKRESVIALALAAACFGLAWLAFEWRDSLMKKDAAVTVEMADFRPLTVRAEEHADETEAVYGPAFEEEELEQEASEEESTGEDLAGGTAETLAEEETDACTETERGTDAVAETEPESVSAGPVPAAESFPVYAVAGHVLDEELQGYLFQKLTEKGIADWMPIAICQAYQENSFDQYQVTAGKDYGLFQYRLIYWDEWCDRAGVGRGDVFDARRQIDVYTEMVAKWIAEGRSESEVISAHNDGGWVRNIVPGYLNEVSRWFDHCVRVK